MRKHTWKSLLVGLLVGMLLIGCVPGVLAVPTIKSSGVAPEDTGTAYESNQTVTVDGSPASLSAYALKDAAGNPTNYMKLRDIADLLDGTAAQFNLGWDGTINILTEKPYTDRNGQEGKTPYSGDQAYKKNTASTKIDGEAIDIQAFVITDADGGDSIYYKLVDVAQALDFNVYWTQATGIVIDTASGYTGTAPAADEATDAEEPEVKDEEAAETIKLNAATLWMNTTDVNTYTLKAAVTPEGTAVAWTTSNPAAATVNNGVVTAVGAGKAIITATTAGGASQSCEVNVAVQAVTDIALNAEQLWLNTDDVKTYTLTATALPANAVNSEITWTTSDASVATVKDGVITAVGGGNAEITASTANGVKKTCKVNVTVVDYSYLCGTDFRSVRRQYSNAVALGASWASYTNSNGEKCVVTYVTYRIISTYSQTTLHNMTTGRTSYDPSDDFDRQINRAYGMSKINLYTLKGEFLTAKLAALNKYQAGDIVPASILNL